MSYIDTLAQRIRAEVPLKHLPREDTHELFRSYAVLLLAKGEAVTGADVHNAWVAWMQARNRKHKALVPFEQLSKEVASSDEPYVTAIHAIARADASSQNEIDKHLFPAGPPTVGEQDDRLFELYKLMVSSSEALVARRQGVNTFFLTINGAILTAAGLLLSTGEGPRLQAFGLLVLTLTGALLSFAWRSLIISFGQLNRGKFAVINRIEEFFPAAIYLAEWKALGEGRQPKKYRPFTSRELWTPKAFILIYLLASLLEVLVVFNFWIFGTP